MARIAEDLFLLLVDNASAQPALEPARLNRVLAAAVLLDLAYACRVRPAVPGDDVEAGRLIALRAPAPADPVEAQAFTLLQRRALRPEAALKKLGKVTGPALTAHLERSGQWPLTDRSRVELARSALTSALFDREPPSPPTAAVISLLHAVDGLGALLSLNDRGWRWVHARAGEIALGSWVNESPTALPEMNLAITMSALRGALD